MNDISNLEIIFRLILSIILGGLIGLEREVGNRPAGLRTHILVTTGATLIMLVSIYGFTGQSDPSRIAAQVVSGIGFLGAGTILRTGNGIQGLTTAASLWVCAGLGLAIGSGLYLIALISTILVLVSLIIFVHLEKVVFIKTKKVFNIIAMERSGLIGDIGSFIGEYDLIIKKIDLMPIAYSDGDSRIEIRLVLDVKSEVGMDKIIGLMYEIEGIQSISID